MKLASIKELEAYLEAYPDTDTLELLLSDQSGYLRGKRVSRSAFEKVFTEGVCLPASVFGLDATGTTVEETGLGFETGDRDGTCFPIPSTLVPVPWHPNRAQVLVTMVDENDEPFGANPRQVLTEVAEHLTAKGITSVIAVELEFYLIDRKFVKSTGLPQPPVSQKTGERSQNTQVYSMEDLDDFREFIDCVMHYSKVQNLPADGVIAEYAPGQFEVNLYHVNDPCLAADQATMLKRIIRQAASEFEMKATFMAKPYIEESGSGTHIHCSILDKNGDNMFAANRDLLQHAIGGLLDTLVASQVLMFPTQNSYKRLGAGTYAPHARTWGWDNRSVAVRVPNSPEHALRVEHRVAGADSNPYLSVALVLAGIDYGLTHKMTPPAPIDGNAYEQVPMELTDSPRVAVRNFTKHQAFANYFNPTFQKTMLAVREADIRLFNKQISALEYEILIG
jgi:glutamine synthetase